jgi:glycosyltransferase involved in cell wall biosynthesis
LRVIIIAYTDFPHYEGLSKRIMGLCNATKFASFILLAPAVEREIEGYEGFGNLRVIRYRLSFLRKIMRNRVLYNFLLNIFLTLALFLDIAKLKRLQANIIQAEQQFSLIPSLIIGSLLRKKVIVDDVLLVDEELKARVPSLVVLTWKIIERIVISLCTVVVFSSRDVRGKFSLLKRSVAVIPNGIFMPSDSPRPRIFDNRTLLFMGSMYSSQNRRALVSATRIFQKISEAQDNIRLFVVGGPLDLLDKEILKAAKKNNRIAILGYVTDELKCQLISEADLILMPYFDSPLSGGLRIKALEFLSHGKVMVSSWDGVGGIVGIEDGKNVLIAETPQAFINTINKYFSNPGNYHAIKVEARELAKKYSWEKIAERYKKVLSQLT